MNAEALTRRPDLALRYRASATAVIGSQLTSSDTTVVALSAHVVVLAASDEP